MKYFLIFHYFCVLLFGFCCAENREIFNWNTVDYKWTFWMRDYFLKKGLYQPTNNLPVGIEIWGEKMFITVPRWKKGVPSTLNYISLDSDNKSPALTPYPNWAANDLHFASKLLKNQIVSALRTRVDACDRLWVLDEGILERFADKVKIRNPTLFIYDLTTDELLEKYEFTDNDTPVETFIADVVVDIDNRNCLKAFAYVSEPRTQTILVYSLEKNRSWAVKHSFLGFDPLQTNYYIAGINFQWTDGVFGVTLAENKRKEKCKALYFQPLSSTHIYSVCTEVLKTEKLLKHPDFFYFFSVEGTKGKNTQGSSMLYDKDSQVVFTTQINKNGIACWNTEKDLNSDNFDLILRDDETIIYPNDLKIGNGRKLYLLANKLPVLFYSNITVGEINFRIFQMDIDDLIAKSNCNSLLK